MGRILLADDSPHALRMGQEILVAEGFDLVTAADGEAALAHLLDSDPDVFIADSFLPARDGFDLTRWVRERKESGHVRVVLTAAMLEPFDPAKAEAAGAHAVLRKPFEASELIALVKRLAAEASAARQAGIPAPEPDRERVRAAVTLALDAALPRMIEELTDRVLVALRR
ncbi:MAG: response regulator [Acidobacteria bacterium]|nr:response regulator [Acidobacteriota bacterium]